MLYDTLKIVHILSATLLLMGIVTCTRAWVIAADKASAALFIQAKTFSIIIPFALLQLLTGFTMISLKHYALSDTWIKGSLIAFLILIASWFAFLFTSKKRLQKIFLSLCMIAIGSMIFFMANKV